MISRRARRSSRPSSCRLTARNSPPSESGRPGADGSIIVQGAAITDRWLSKERGAPCVDEAIPQRSTGLGLNIPVLEWDDFGRSTRDAGRRASKRYCCIFRRRYPIHLGPQMKITEYFERAEGPLISYEIIPPKRGGTVREILDVVAELMPFEPPFIDVTSHAAQAWYEELEDGTIKRHVKRKRPGTLGICAAIKNRFGIEAVPHLLCLGFTREETEDALIELNYLGIHNLMALKGDDHGYRKPVRRDRSVNTYAVDLVRQIYDMNAGKYLEDLVDATPTEFCVGVSGYPEKHFEAPNIGWDILNLKRKIEAGAEYVVTQMFFDNARYFEFVERCRNVGITVPIIPGVKVLTGKNQLQTLPGNFYVSIPEDLAAEVEAADPERVTDVGIEWAVRQCDELLSAGAPSIHFYIMQRALTIKTVVERLRKMA